jgi:uncharacterized protein with von Willebrand factor type A (vWA) domain
MGEIKSTLDIVLEKTKNLKLTSAEKVEQQHKEIETRIKAMLQKYQDGLCTREDFMAEYQLLQKDFNLGDSRDLANEIFRRIDPDRDNQPLLELLEHCCHLHSAGIATVVNDYRKTYRAAARNRMKRIKADLAQKYSISGSAVVPNLAQDEPWKREAQALRSGFDRQLKGEKEMLLDEG